MRGYEMACSDAAYLKREEALEQFGEGRPTVYPPGSTGKLVVMSFRKHNREPLFHEYDARYEGDELPLRWLEGQVAA